MKLCFDSIEEVQDFVKRLKGTRGGKDKDDGEGTAGQAPAPLTPPQGPAPSFNPIGTQFAPPVGGAGPTGGGFPVAAAIDPQVAALVHRISTRTNDLVKGGQDAVAMLTWFRSQCGPEAANATMEQIQTVFLPRSSVPTLEQLAKLTGA